MQTNIERGRGSCNCPNKFVWECSFVPSSPRKRVFFGGGGGVVALFPTNACLRMPDRNILFQLLSQSNLPPKIWKVDGWKDKQIIEEFFITINWVSFGNASMVIEMFLSGMQAFEGNKATTSLKTCAVKLFPG